VLNGRRVDVRHLEIAPIAVDDEASKKSVSMVYYGNHNYRTVGVGYRWMQRTTDAVYSITLRQS